MTPYGGEPPGLKNAPAKAVRLTTSEVAERTDPALIAKLFALVAVGVVDEPPHADNAPTDDKRRAEKNALLKQRNVSTKLRACER
jgi:hypothetical protein